MSSCSPVSRHFHRLEASPILVLLGLPARENRHTPVGLWQLSTWMKFRSVQDKLFPKYPHHHDHSELSNTGFHVLAQPTGDKRPVQSILLAKPLRGFKAWRTHKLLRMSAFIAPKIYCYFRAGKEKKGSCILATIFPELLSSTVSLV